MNIIFPFIFSLFDWLAVIIWMIQENSIKWNKLKKYRKSPRNVPHWNMKYQVLYEDCKKSLEVKSEKKWFAECQKMTLGKSPLCRVSGEDTRQRVNGGCRPLTAAALLPSVLVCLSARHSANMVFAECYCLPSTCLPSASCLPSARHSANHLFAECQLFAECFLSGTR